MPRKGLQELEEAVAQFSQCESTPSVDLARAGQVLAHNVSKIITDMRAAPRGERKGLPELDDALARLTQAVHASPHEVIGARPLLAEMARILSDIRAEPPWPTDIDVRRLKLGPRDLLAVSTPKTLNPDQILRVNETVRAALKDAGHPETKVLILTEGTSLGVIEPEAEPQG